MAVVRILANRARQRQSKRALSSLEFCMRCDYRPFSEKPRSLRQTEDRPWSNECNESSACFTAPPPVLSGFQWSKMVDVVTNRASICLDLSNRVHPCYSLTSLGPGILLQTPQCSWLLACLQEGLGQYNGLSSLMAPKYAVRFQKPTFLREVVFDISAP